MKPHTYCHTIRFRGSAHPQGRYQLQISEVGNNGQPQYRAQWDFPTLRNLLVFLKTYFPNSQALMSAENQSLAFEQVLAIAAF
ncbi:hypothetical protein OsccyDRAFT_3256 [Leptolyngbyaceae cyanobacterium JSC-12]|nr:hypothetical protein OsccyDRAFT_3256 [Leptolyngbyaceae cyanobacterium JSC-12]